MDFRFRLVGVFLMKFCFENIRPIKTKGFIRLIITAYVTLGLVWITISTTLPDLLSGDPQKHSQIELQFDIGLIILTAGILALLGRRFLNTLRSQQDEFYQLIRNVGSARGQQFFPALVHSLAETTNASTAFIARFTDESQGRVKTVAVFSHGQLVENLEFAIEGTPCGIIIPKGSCCYPSKVRKLFPLDPLSNQLKVDNYVGIALNDCSGRCHGVMAVAGEGTLDNQRLAESMLELFAVRAAAGLEGMANRETIDYMSMYDSLTGLPNRRMFTKRLAPILINSRQKSEISAVLFLDLDRFKNINDSLGHAAGDLLLMAVADRLTRCLRRGDLVARLGGDEFMVLLQGLAQKQDAAKIAAKVLDSLKSPFKILEHELHIALSIGIALSPEHGDDVDTLLKNADTAMNRAKEVGRNTYQFFATEMGAISITRLGLENDLRKALIRNELILHFQPQYNLEGGRITGVEALLRWQHPERGMVQPDNFIPMAEETGQIVPIGKWVIREACEQSRRWSEEGFAPIQMAVNLSAKQFQQQDLPDVVAAILKETGMNPEYLELEITETILMQNLETTIDQLVRLMALGVKISIDDFGTGYSSLNYLKRFPLHALKIDRSFVKDIGEDSDESSIVSAIISLAHNLSLEVVAEGVETQGQLEFLRSQQCDRFQGFLMSTPVPAENIQQMLEQGRLSAYMG